MTTGTTVATGEEIAPPPGGLRAPCPCGSGKRYKQCHGRLRARDAFVARPFEGVPRETDLVAFREIVPAATMAGRTVDGDDVTFVTVLPTAWPALRRPDGGVVVGVQTTGASSDLSRDLAAALDAALDGGPGPVTGAEVQRRAAAGGPRLQERIASFERPRVRDGFGFWVEGLTDGDEVGEPGTLEAVRASIERADEAAVPTEDVTSVESAYWVRLGGTTFVRWVVPFAEEGFLDGLARLHAGLRAGRDADADPEDGPGSGLGPGTRFAGAFRAHGLLVPVWDLGPEATAEGIEEPLAAFADRIGEAMAVTAPLGAAERRARAGLVSRQVTLR